MRILIVEDSRRLGRSIQLGLTREGFAVDLCENGTEALRLILNNPLDLVVLDLMLPGLDGLEVLSRVREQGNDVPVLILTARDSTPELVEGFQSGADDYLVKPFAFDELVVRCRALLRRKLSPPRVPVRIGQLEFEFDRRVVRKHGQPLTITARDLRLLEYLVLHQGAVVTREELEDHIYSTSRLPSSNAIDSAICVLRRKLDDPDAEQSLIKTVRGIGYTIEAPEA